MKTLNIAKILAFGLLAPTLVFAQSTSTLDIAIDRQSIQILDDGDGRINLLAEALKQYPTLKTSGPLEISTVRLDGRSGVGGAQVFLRINNNVVDGVVIETNSDLQDKTDTEYKKFELKNIDRSPLTEASLHLQSGANMRIKNIQIVLGSPQEPAIFGHYADQQVSQIGGGVADSSDEPTQAPTPEQVAAVMERYYGQMINPIAAPDQTATVQTPIAPAAPIAPVIPANKECLLGAYGPVICIGAIVSEKVEGTGVVTAINFSAGGNHQVTVALTSGRTIYTMLSQVTVIDNQGRFAAGPACVKSICVRQTVMDRTSQKLDVRDIQTFRNSALVIAENRYGQLGAYAVDDLYTAAAVAPTPQPKPQVVQQPAAPQQSRPPVAYNPKKCVKDKRSRQICVGSRVSAFVYGQMEYGYILNLKNKAIGTDKVDIHFDRGFATTVPAREVTGL